MTNDNALCRAHNCQRFTVDVAAKFSLDAIVSLSLERKCQRSAVDKACQSQTVYEWITYDVPLRSDFISHFPFPPYSSQPASSFPTSPSISFSFSVRHFLFHFSSHFPFLSLGIFPSIGTWELNFSVRQFIPTIPLSSSSRELNYKFIISSSNRSYLFFYILSTHPNGFFSMHTRIYIYCPEEVKQEIIFLFY